MENEVLVREGHPATVLVLDEVRRAREAQDFEHGVRRHPSLDQVLQHRPGGCTPERMAEEYEMPSETRAVQMMENAFGHGQGTWAHLAVLDLARVIASPHEDAMRHHLTNLAALTTAWIEDIDRRVS